VYSFDRGHRGGSGDYMALYPHGTTNTHLDALCHIVYKGKLYNGRDANLITMRGAQAGGLEAVFDGVVSRGIVLDVPRALGVKWVEPDQAITVEDLTLAEEKQGVTVRSGDVLLVRTGRWARVRAGEPIGEIFGADGSYAMSGLGIDSIPWLASRQVAVLGSDGVSDALPAAGAMEGMPVHLIGIAGMGIHLIDNADLEAVSEHCAASSRWEFQCILSPLRVPGGTGSPLNPLAVF
jgi:kynurenine formamidase